MSNLHTIDKHLRPILIELLSQCTKKQQAFFKRMYKDVNTMNVEKIPRAIEQCEATILKNETKNI